MRCCIASGILAVGFLGSASADQEPSASADQELTEEELVAPLVKTVGAASVDLSWPTNVLKLMTPFARTEASITWSSTLACGWSKRGGSATR